MLFRSSLTNNIASQLSCTIITTTDQSYSQLVVSVIVPPRASQPHIEDKQQYEHAHCNCSSTCSSSSLGSKQEVVDAFLKDSNRNIEKREGNRLEAPSEQTSQRSLQNGSRTNGRLVWNGVNKYLIVFLRA